MSKEEIALQLTLKSIEKMGTHFTIENLSQNNLTFSNDVVAFYNNILEKINVNSH